MFRARQMRILFIFAKNSLSQLIYVIYLVLSPKSTNPCAVWNEGSAVWNEGSVSLGDKTEEDMNGRDVDVFLGVVVEEPRPRFVSSRTRR